MSSDTDSLFAAITAKIVKALKQGDRPFRPWRRSGRPLRHDGVPFTGLNSLILLMAADENGYESPYWLTAAQGKRCRGNVRDDQADQGTPVLRPVVAPLPSYALRAPNVATQRAWKYGDGERVRVRMKPYRVFNAEQFDRLPRRFQPGVAPDERLDTADRIHRAEQFLNAVEAKVAYGGERAFYRERDDLVQLPNPSRFWNAEGYYATLAHELVHWTGHPTRLNRDPAGLRFRDGKERAFEELVAEFGSAYLMGVVDMASEPREDHARYIGSWIKRLEEDSGALRRATDDAQTAANYVTIASHAGRVDELATLRLDDRDYLALYFDRVNVRSYPILVAIGLDARGYRRTVGVSSGSPELGANWKQAATLLSDLANRGLCPDRRRLFVTGGSADLPHAIRAVCGPDSMVQRCRSTVVRTVLSALKPPQDGAQGETDSTALLTRERVQQGIREAFRRGESWGHGAPA